MSRLFFACLLVFFNWACGGGNNKEENSPFTELLSSPLYSSFTDSIRKSPKNPELYFRRAVILNANNEAEPALEDFRKAWSLEKNEKYALGVSTLLLDKKPDSAMAFIRKALEFLPQSMLLRLSLARALDAQNKADEALAICNEILTKNPKQVDILKMKAGLLNKKGLPADALQILEFAYSLTPYDVELNYMLALRLAEAKNPKLISLCDSLIRADSLGNHAEPYYYKGIYYSNTANRPAAIEQFDEAIKHDYYFLDAYIEKGSVYYDQKKYTEALKVFRLANTLSPAFPDAWYWMAKCQEAMGQKTEAKLNYEKAFGLDKNFTEAKEGADRLKN